MMKRTATVHREVVGYLRFLCIFARKDIRNANANRMNLFSRAKSGKFSTGENKSTYPIHIIWRGLLFILAHRFTRACTIK